MRKALATLATLAAFSVPCFAQGTMPPDATPLTAKDLRDTLAGKVFKVKGSSGPDWRFQFNDNGYYFLNVGQWSDSGKWRTEDGKLCTEPRTSNAGCNDMRVAAGRLFLKRSNGAIVEFEPN